MQLNRSLTNWFIWPFEYCESIEISDNSSSSPNLILSFISLHQYVIYHFSDHCNLLENTQHV